jgi:hypothetical protein
MKFFDLRRRMSKVIRLETGEEPDRFFDWPLGFFDYPPAVFLDHPAVRSKRSFKI